MGFSRSFKISLLLSTVIHFGTFVALSHESVASKIAASPEIVLAKRSQPKTVRFELVETPKSAEVAEPPKETDLISDKNTRAQDRFQGDKKLEDSPHMEGKHDDSKDTRPRAVVTQPPPEQVSAAPVPEPAEEKRPEPRAVPKEPARQPEKPKIQAEPEPKTEPAKSESESVEVAPEKREKEVIQLAKKAPEPTPPVPTTAPKPGSHVISVTSSNNPGADAEIMGELSFGATRHFFGEYLVKMKQAVERQWVSLLVTKYTGIVSSEAVIDFKIQPDGRVTDMMVRSVEGDNYFSVVCVSSIRDAQPFERIPYEEIPGLPENYMDKPLNIRFTFRYN